MSSPTLSSGLDRTLLEKTFAVVDEIQENYDVVIQFHSADGIPKMDIIGHADPYFIASIDDEITLTSPVIPNTATPAWEDEKWIVRNIPINAKLFVKVYDKDDDTVGDDYIGQFVIFNLITYHAPPDGHEILGASERINGHFHLSIHSMPSTDETKRLPPYTFDGPCRYFRNDSLAIGRLTMLHTDCVYSTWKIRIRRISVFFDLHDRQHWNTKYSAAQAIFGHCPLTLATQSTIKIAHKVLFGQTIKNTDTGHLTNAEDLWTTIFTDQSTKKVRLCLYSYVVDDYTWRFSETDDKFFADFVSKHALLANCCEYVRYAGEFHPRPKHGWDRCDDEWELVFDNGSGTYAPDPNLLNNLKELLAFNFPRLNVVVYDHDDPRLKESIEEMRHVAKNHLDSVATIKNLVLK